MTANTGRSTTVALRYWGSHFKSLRYVRLFRDEFRPLAEAGWETHLVLERYPDETGWLTELEQSNVHVHVCPRPKRHLDIETVWRVRSLCRTLRPAVFHCDNIHTSPLLGARLAGVRGTVWQKRAMNTAFEEGRSPGWKERLAVTTRVSCAAATSVIAVSEAVRQELLDLGVAPEKVVVRYNPVRLRELLPRTDRSAARASFGLREKDVAVLTVGHAVPVKGWDLLVRSFARVAECDHRARLILVGSHSAPHETATFSGLQRLITDLRLEERILFPGHQVDVRPAFLAADVFVLPSHSEGCSNVLIEALQARLPCVATRVGHAPEAIQDGVNGLLVDRHDEKGLSEALLRLVTRDDVRAAFAAAASVPSFVPSGEDYGRRMAADYDQLRRGRRLN